MTTNPNIKELIAALPLLPGIYKFLNKDGKVIYVGKAKSLRKRVSSYFSNSEGQSSKVKVLVRHIVSIEHITVQTEYDALLLESNLIKNLQPHYNILLKDDKSYPWIIVRNEPFPRIESTRRVLKDGSKYYGPYASIGIHRNLLELIHNLYPIRTCSLNLSEEMIAKGNYNVCLQYHIKNCKAPCVSKQLPSEYATYVDMVRSILGGDLKVAKKYLEGEMSKAAEQLNFEVAQNIKMRLDLLENYRAKSVIVSTTISDLTVFGILIDDESAYGNITKIVAGGVVNSLTVELSLGAEIDKVTILTQAIEYLRLKANITLSDEVVVPFMPNTELFPDSEFRTPQRGDKLKLLEFAERNCRIFKLEQMRNMEIKEPNKHTSRVMSAMKRELYMDVEPRHIECFDNSNIQGTNAVAACVVFRDGKPSKREYRHFNIKTVVGPDDYASMQEILFRRYRRLLEENKQLPDLIVIDGGKGQLSAAYDILQQLGIEDEIKIIGLAKRIEEVFFPNDSQPYYLDRRGEPLRVLMHIRDEAHRFGITFHRNKRSAGFIKSELEGIKGISKISSEKLMKHFKTINGIKKASIEELGTIVGRHKATTILDYFSPKDK